MKRANILITVILGLIMVSGCSSNIDRYAAAQQEQKKQKDEYMKHLLNQTPDWYINPPQSGDNGVYATATAAADDLNASKNVALLNAEFSIGKHLAQEIYGRERQNTKVSSGTTDTLSEQTIVKLVKSAKVVGYDVVETKYIVNDGKYHTFVLIHLPYEKYKKILNLDSNSFEDESKKNFEEVSNLG